jgi:hypothetical protein
MSNFGGYLQLRRAIFEHVRNGRLSHMECLAYVYIASQADTRSGVWCGSSGALAGEICYPERLARCILESLSRKHYIKRFPTPGRHFCYPILVNKYLVTDGEHAGQRLNAIASQSWSQLVFEKIGSFCEQNVKLNVEQNVKQTAPQNRIKNRELRIKTPRAAKPAAPADPRFQSFVDFAYASYSGKHGQKPHWGARDFKSLKALLGQGQNLTSAELERRWTHYSGSTEPFTTKQGDSLSYFCAKFDSFIDGPILGSTGGKTDGKAVSGHQERQKRTLEARDRALSRGSGWTDADKLVVTAGSQRG